MGIYAVTRGRKWTHGPGSGEAARYPMFEEYVWNPKWARRFLIWPDGKLYKEMKMRLTQKYRRQPLNKKKTYYLHR